MDSDSKDDYDGHYNEKQSEKDRKQKGASKSKDLSHVPCKFFKVGSCTAGASCPFSHHILEPGQQKEICSWFVKGNCKFGHKCALAHVLPGQSMSMDRRNKKAAQQAASQVNKEGGGGGGSKERERDRGDKSRSQRPSNQASGAGPSASNAAQPRASSAQTRTGLLAGSTAPTRVLASGARPPLPISKAVPAPAEPAPTLKDADFTSVDATKTGTEAFSGSDNANANATNDVLENAPNQSDPKIIPESTSASTATAPIGSPPSNAPNYPIASPTQPVRFSGRHGSKPSVDFGPIGSPTRSSPANPTRINGFSPGTSPRDGAIRPPPIISGSPFSAPGSQSLFMPFERPDSAGDSKGRSGLAVSLGATRTLAQFGGHRVDLEEGDDDMEEFVPSSLTDLLTPEEQNRRMSRASSGNANAGIGGGGGLVGAPGSQAAGLQDSRFSRSVPATSVLGDLKSIWSDTRHETPVGRPLDVLGNTNAGPGHGHGHGHGHGYGHGQTLAVGSPSSFNSGSGFAARAADGPSPSLLSPSNASAAFLPGLHHHYLSRPPPGAARNVNVMFANNNTVQQQPPERTYGNLNGLSVSPSRLPDSMAATNQSIHDILSSSPSTLHQLPSGRPIPSKGFLNAELPLSPSARALQAHAPGQSLPQGLAAGYSRIHVQPPPNIPSPSATGASFSPGTSGLHPQLDLFGHQDWGMVMSGGAGLGANGKGVGAGTPTSSSAMAPPMSAGMPGPVVSNTPMSSSSNLNPNTPLEAKTSVSGMQGAPGTPPSSAGFDHAAVAADRDVGGLSTMFSRLSYSAAAARGTNAAGTVPMSMARKTSGQRWVSHPMSSPLSGPVLTNDDDVLFSMDEEVK